MSPYKTILNNFFTAHPDGTYRISYPKAVQESSLMENLPDKYVIASRLMSYLTKSQAAPALSYKFSEVFACPPGLIRMNSVLLPPPSAI